LSRQPQTKMIRIFVRCRESKEAERLATILGWRTIRSKPHICLYLCCVCLFWWSLMFFQLLSRVAIELETTAVQCLFLNVNHALIYSSYFWICCGLIESQRSIQEPILLVWKTAKKVVATSDGFWMKKSVQRFSEVTDRGLSGELPWHAKCKNPNPSCIYFGFSILLLFGRLLFFVFFEVFSGDLGF